MCQLCFDFKKAIAQWRLHHAKEKQIPLVILSFSILFLGSLKSLVKSAEMPWFTNSLIKEMVTDFLPTSLISNEHSTLRSVCISRQIISLSKLALMMGSGGGWWWWGGECAAERRLFASKSLSCSTHRQERLLIVPADKGIGGPCRHSQ